MKTIRSGVRLKILFRFSLVAKNASAEIKNKFI